MKCPRCGGTGEAPDTVAVPIELPRSLHAGVVARAAEEGIPLGRLVTTLLAVWLRDPLARPGGPAGPTRNPGYYDSDSDDDL